MSFVPNAKEKNQGEIKRSIFCFNKKNLKARKKEMLRTEQLIRGLSITLSVFKSLKVNRV